eukprot:1810459-Rhodomonas_salina.1
MRPAVHSPVEDPGKGTNDLCSRPGSGQPILRDGRPAVCSSKRLSVCGKQGSEAGRLNTNV